MPCSGPLACWTPHSKVSRLSSGPRTLGPSFLGRSFPSFHQCSALTPNMASGPAYLEASRNTPLPQMTGGFGSGTFQMPTLVLPQWVIHSQQNRWPQGVAVECLRSSKHSVHSGFLEIALSSAWLLAGVGGWDTTELVSCRAPGEPAPAPCPRPAPRTCGGTGRAAASTPSGRAASAGSRRAVGLRPAPGAAGTLTPAAGSWHEREGPLRVGGGHGAVRTRGTVTWSEGVKR